MIADAALFFFVTLGICAAIVQKSPWVRAALDWFGDHLQVKAFPSASDNEYIKFALLRIVFGIILLYRAINIYRMLLPEELFAAIGLWSLADIVVSFFLIIGVMTQWSLVFMMLLMWRVGESVMGTSTLGNDIAGMTSLLLFLTQSGKYLSVDAYLLKPLKKFSAYFLYSPFDPNRRTIALAKFCCLLGYFVVCVYSLCMHLNEPAWMTGVAGPLLLSNNFMSSHYDVFASVFTHNAWAVHVAMVSLWVMMVWYPTIIPLTLLGGMGRSYIIIWGILFFILSKFGLNLGSLAEMEFVMWAGVYWWKTGIDQKQKLSIFFDDTCNLCDRTVHAITFLDIFDRVTLRPLSQHKDQLQSHGINHEQALTDLYGLNESNNALKRGYDFYIMLSKHLVLLWPMVPFLMLGKMVGVGPALYRMIADKRKQLFGVCRLPTKKWSRPSPILSETPAWGSQSIVLHVFVLACCYLVAIPMPYLNISGFHTIGAVAAHNYGMAGINVFNRGDLKMAENWFTLRDIHTGEILPLLKEDGSRLWMHKSDRVYFGHTLQFRRGTIDKDECAFDAWRNKIEYLSKVYLHMKRAESGNHAFEYTQYFQPLPDDKDIVAGRFIQQPKTIKCTARFEINS